MILTEDEASNKFCPFSLSSNPVQLRQCEGSACMGWRWVGWRDFTNQAVFTGDRPRTEDDERVGTCGFKAPRNDA